MISRLMIVLSIGIVSSPCLAEVFEPIISQGERITIEEREFSIEPPFGWEVYRDYNGAMLYFQAPKEEGILYQRYIRIMSFVGPKYIDQMTFQSFGKEIVENSSKMSNAVSDYRLRNQMAIEIADGRKAGLYYAEFNIQDVPLMQMHILVSSANFHFLMTFTDLMVNFEQNDSPQLNEAFASLQSVMLSGAPPKRNTYFYLLSIGLGGLFVLFIIVKVARSLRVKRLAKGLDEFDEEGETSGDDDIHVDESYISSISKETKKKEKKKSGLFKKKEKFRDDEVADDVDMPVSDIGEEEDPPVKKKKIRIGGKKRGAEAEDLDDPAELAGDEDGDWKF